MRINDPEEGKAYPVYLFVAVLPYSQLAYVEPCLNMNEQTWISGHGIKRTVVQSMVIESLIISFICLF
ncbi:MAG: hypothetical protein IIY35_05885, partial [Ruminococcus sp.]|nr:hypothetical protein [Ruminococcus sp.]